MKAVRKDLKTITSNANGDGGSHHGLRAFLPTA